MILDKEKVEIEFVLIWEEKKSFNFIYLKEDRLSYYKSRLD